VRARGLLFAMIVSGCAASPPAEAPVEPGRPAAALPRPGLARGESIAARNRECVGCHAEVAAEWAGSLHRNADRDPVYQRALAIEPLAFCRSCHAPEADPAGPAPATLSEIGVGCVTCHLAGDAVLAAPSDAPSLAPHPVVRDARFAGAGACAGCHEFAFPDAALRPTPELMQSTVTEHGESEHAAVPCAACHMPKSGRRRHHGFAGQRDPSVLARALRARAERTGPTSMLLELTAEGVGHAFPTGDLFRRLEVSVEGKGDDFASVAGTTRYLARHYRPLSLRGAPRRVVADDRLGVRGERTRRVEIDLGAAAAGYPIVWRVAYQRVQHPLGISDERAEVASEVTLAQGELSPEEGRP
jgi:hypothetical protein